MAEIKTIQFGELEINAEVDFEKGTPCDGYTAPTADRWNLTGRYYAVGTGTNISIEMKFLNWAYKGKIFTDFDDQING